MPITGGLRTGDILYFSYYLSLQQQFTVTVSNVSSATLYVSNSYRELLDDSFRKFLITGSSRNVTINACDYGGDITGLWYFALLNTGPRSYFQIRATSASTSRYIGDSNIKITTYFPYFPERIFHVSYFLE